VLRLTVATAAATAALQRPAIAALPDAVLAAPKPRGRLVVIDSGTAYASDDDGASFHAVYRSEGFVVADAALAADGTLFVLRRAPGWKEPIELDIVRASSPTSRPAPGGHHVIAQAGVVAVLREAGIDVSADGGATFTTRSLPEPCTGCQNDWWSFETMALGAVAGSVFVADTEISTCTSDDVVGWQRLVRLAPGGATTQRTLSIPLPDLGAHWRFGAFGWLYGVSLAHRIVSVSAAGAQPVRGLPPLRPGRVDVFVANNGTTTLAAWETTLVELSGADGHVLDGHGKEVQMLAVDGDGRALVHDGTNLWRFSRVHGWTRLSVP
jgi:hypothetical protein